MLSGRVALVTGGASGICRAIAIELTARGARVALVDLDGLEASAAAAGCPGTIARACDVVEPTPASPGWEPQGAPRVHPSAGGSPGGRHGDHRPVRLRGDGLVVTGLRPGITVDEVKAKTDGSFEVRMSPDPRGVPGALDPG